MVLVFLLFQCFLGCPKPKPDPAPQPPEYQIPQFGLLIAVDQLQKLTIIGPVKGWTNSTNASTDLRFLQPKTIVALYYPTRSEPSNLLGKWGNLTGSDIADEFDGRYRVKFELDTVRIKFWSYINSVKPTNTNDATFGVFLDSVDKDTAGISTIIDEIKAKGYVMLMSCGGINGSFQWNLRKTHSYRNNTTIICGDESLRAKDYVQFIPANKDVRYMIEADQSTVSTDAEKLRHEVDLVGLVLHYDAKGYKNLWFSLTKISTDRSDVTTPAIVGRDYGNALGEPLSTNVYAGIKVTDAGGTAQNVFFTERTKSIVVYNNNVFDVKLSFPAGNTYSVFDIGGKIISAGTERTVPAERWSIILK